MKEFNVVKIFDDFSEAKGEILDLRFTWAVLKICSSALSSHPGSGEVLEMVSSAEGRAKDRIAEISQWMDGMHETVARARDLLSANPIVITKQ
jgi:hypothetical protein